MAYHGNVKLPSDDGKTFTFDSPEGVVCLQYWTDMVSNNLTARDLILAKEDRPGLERFSAGQPPFYATGPQVFRIIKHNKPSLYPKFPNASLALAMFLPIPKA